MNELIIVLTRNYSTGLSIIRSLGAAGFTVDMIYSARRKRDYYISASSKYLRRSTFIKCGKNTGDGKKIIRELTEYDISGFDKVMLFPTDDFDVSVVNDAPAELAGRYIIPGIKNAETSMAECMDKSYQSKIAAACGISTPKEWVVDLSADEFFPEDMVYPCFCKPLESVSGYKSEMKKCENEDGLRSHLKRLKGKNPNRKVLIQEFLEISEEIDFSGVCLGDTVIIPGIIRKTRIAQHEKGVTLAGVIHPFEELGDLCPRIVDFMKRFSYHGMFDMEINVTGRGFFFNEVNFRCGGPNYSYYQSGVNLPALAACGLLGRERAPESIIYGKSFIYEKVAWEDYCYGFLSRAELKDLLRSSDIRLISGTDDRRPGLVFWTKNYLGRIKHRLGNGAGKIRRGIHAVKMKIAPVILRYPQNRRSSSRSTSSYPEGTVLIFGRNYCTNLCMARSFARAGYRAEVLRVFQNKDSFISKLIFTLPETRSKYVSSFDICVSYRRNSAIVKKLIGMAGDGRKLLVGADDLCVSIVDSNLDILNRYFIIADPQRPGGTVNELMKKNVQKDLAEQIGLPTAGSTLIRTESHRFVIPESVHYPCFIKPNVSKNSSKSKMERCDNEEDLIKAISRQARRKDVEILVEDFVEIRREYSVIGVSDGKTVNCDCFMGHIIGGQGAHRGVAMTGEIMDVNYLGTFADKLKEYVLATGYVGMYDIDLVEDIHGKMLFVEMNCRLGASGYAFDSCGANLCGMYAGNILHDIPIEGELAIRGIGKTFVSEKVLFEEYQSKNISFRQLEETRKNADILFIGDPDDKAPYRYFRRYRLYMAFKHMLGR